jgi:glycosyltransferase involved in cell wall biosynthesis
MLSVIVCTRNRSAMLRRCLQAMCELDGPSTASWELLVVDNGSTDDTASVIDTFSSRLPLRPVKEATAGLSHARNRAVREARGEWLLWCDDDALVDKQWLSAYAEAFARWPNGVVFGGPILPELEGIPPRWLTAALGSIGGAYAARDLGPELMRLTIAGDRVPYGANFAVRADAQRRFAYDPRLGRQPGDRGVVGEESAVIEQLLAAGGEGWWVPDARVRHIVPPERQTVRYLREYMTGYGETMAVRATDRPHAHTDALPPSWWTAARAELRYRGHRVVSPPARWVREMVIASVLWGQRRRRSR